MNADVLIVGQGICGSLLSWSLIQRGISVMVYDPDHSQSATRAASAIINPITGKRFVKTWLADEAFPVAYSMYTELEKALSVSFFEKQAIYKILTSVKEQNDISARASEPGYEKYFSDIVLHQLDPALVNNPLGAFVVNGGAKMDTDKFLEHYRHFLKSKEMLTEEKYTIEQALSEKRRVIFCDGYRSAQTGLFSGLQWQIVKGEYLLVRIKNFFPDRIISGDTTISAMPGIDTFYAGATYQWHYETEAPTEQYKNEIIASLKKMLPVPFELLYHGAGIRPSVKYRRPFLGFHPVHKHIGIFNGMGTKGISLSPYFAAHFAEHIVSGFTLLDEVNISNLIKTNV